MRFRYALPTALLRVAFWVLVFTGIQKQPARAQKPAGPGPVSVAVAVAVLGDSRTDGCVGNPKAADCRQRDSGFNEPVLTALLGFAAEQRPDAVFFTGDLTLGLEREEEDGHIDEGALPAAGGWARNFQYDPKTFVRMLTAFKKIVSEQLKSIPFYPVVGNHDTVGPDAVEVFRKTFGLQRPADSYGEPSHLTYTIELRGNVFVVIATDYYQSCAERGVPASTCNVQEHRMSQHQLAWLDRQLAKHAGKRLFVLGHEPAWSSGSAKLGLDHDEAARDAFWKILKNRRVTAYLCSHQHQLHISRHDGVWQLISGGAGAPLDGSLKTQTGAPPAQCTGGVPLRSGFADRSFFHYVIMRLPESADGVPSIEVRDCRNTLRRQLDLTR